MRIAGEMTTGGDLEAGAAGTEALEPVESWATLDALLAASMEQPVLVFKHSRTCGVSAEALDELRAYLSTAEAAPRTGLIVVQSHRDLSSDLARQVAIRHESPQVMLLHGGRAVWHASHFRVRSQTIAAAVNAARES